MSWAKISLLLAIIALIHVVVIYGCVYAGEDGSADHEQVDPALAQALFNHFFTEKNPVADTAKEGNSGHAQKSKAWDYSRTIQLPAPLARQAGKARSVIIVDLATRRVLYEKNSRDKVAIASLTKLMTLLVVHDQMAADKDLTWNSEVKISPEASAVENARLKRGTYTVKDLVYSMMVGSFNDAATQLAITCHGKTDTFVAAMNQRAADMGFSKARFNSPSGLPQGEKRENSCASAAEILYLCEEVMKNPELKKICGTPRYVLSRGSKRDGVREIGSSNLLINGRNVTGAFGFKTGYTNAAGRCVAFGIERNGRVVLCCITGYPSNENNALFDFGTALANWAFKQDR
jgi:D-alanyl-D-alanine carboxypeptidase (penicillin-binding protein 5/6)